MIKKGKLIAVEGLDGSGKTTQAKLLANSLNEVKVKTLLTNEPSDGYIGKIIRKVLTGELHFEKSVLSCLFIADRLDHISNAESGFLNKIKIGETIICDRYYFSSYAYNGIHVPLEWLINANSLCSSLAKPDLHIFIDTDPEICMKRIHSRQKEKELYEKIELLVAVRKKFFEAFKLMEEKENIIIINGNQTQDKIAETIWSKVSRLYKLESVK